MATIVSEAGFAGPGGFDLRDPRADESVPYEASHDGPAGALNSLPIEIYAYYAAIERKREDEDTRPVPDAPYTAFFKYLIGKGDTIKRAELPEGMQPSDGADTPVSEPGPVAEKKPNFREKVKKSIDTEKRSRRSGSTDEVTVGPAMEALRQMSSIDTQKKVAYHALRTASWQAVFYLITTDVLGYSTAPYAFAQLGYGPGCLTFFFFYALAFCGGQILWRMYLKLDSSHYPVTCYADLGERTYGRYVRHLFNILQSLQIIFNVAILTNGNAQTLASLIEYKFCFIALAAFFALAGGLAGQIRSLRNFAWFSNINIWLNLLIMGMCMGGVAKYAPIPSLTGHKDLSQPVMRSGWVPTTTSGWFNQVNGIQYMVFAYGGAMIFTEFMAEMRRPRDFWKGAFVAQTFCFLCYMFFGLFVYSYQGQYTYYIPTIDFANRSLSLATNIIGLVTALIATVLYGNIGVKVIYRNILMEYLRVPDLMTPVGRIIWSVVVVFYYTLAWVIACAVPNLNVLTSVIGAACILQFTYTFPPILLVGHWVQLDANKADNPWQPGMEPKSNRIDSWRDMTRWKRGFASYWYAKVGLILFFMGGLTLAGLGLYSAIELGIQQFDQGNLLSFSCTAPGQPSSS